MSSRKSKMSSPDDEASPRGSPRRQTLVFTDTMQPLATPLVRFVATRPWPLPQRKRVLLPFLANYLLPKSFYPSSLSGRPPRRAPSSLGVGGFKGLRPLPPTPNKNANRFSIECIVLCKFAKCLVRTLNSKILARAIRNFRLPRQKINLRKHI